MGVANRVEEIAKRVPFLRRPFYQRDVAILERDALAARLAALGDIVRHSAVVPASIPDTRADLRSLSDWKRLLAQNPSIQASAHIARMVSHGMRHGVTSPFLGKIAPSEMELSGTNYREHFVARGFNPRQRAILDLTHEVVGHRSIHDVSIYAHEALTPLALVMRGRYPRFLGSEYAPNPVDRERIFPIPHIDIMKSGLPDECFDIVLSGDVLEHVPDLDAAIRDTARILKSGGCFIASVPFGTGCEETSIRARLVNGAIEHLATPDYHGNPMDVAAGSLVFQVPGWSVLGNALRAGFSDAYMLFWSSAERGYAGDANLSGVLLLVATK